MKNNVLVALAVAIFAIYSCTDFKQDMFPSDAGSVEQAVLDAFGQMFPAARSVTWTDDCGDWMATFEMDDCMTRAESVTRHHQAWFSHRGHWQMTEVSRDLSEMTQPVQDAFAAGDYADWEVQNASSIEKKEVTVLYYIEALGYADSTVVGSVMVDGVLVEKIDTVSYPAYLADLYYSEDGTLVKEKLDTLASHGCDGNHYGNAKPGKGSCEVSEDSTVTRFFDKHGDLLKTETVVDADALPSHVTEAVAGCMKGCDTVAVQSATFVEWARGEKYHQVMVYFEKTGKNGNGPKDKQNKGQSKKESGTVAVCVYEDGSVFVKK